MKLVKIMKIYSEENYDLFELNPNNRDINQNYVKKLAKDIQLDGYNTNFPIIVKEVNNKYRIFKGHHRYTACKMINHPIIFTVDNTLKDEDLIKGEKVQKPINIKDGSKMYDKLGFEEYGKLERIINEYKIPHKMAIIFLNKSGCYDSKYRYDLLYGRLKITEEMEDMLRIRAYNYTKLIDCRNLHYAQNTDFKKILFVLDDYDLTEKFRKYLSRHIFPITSKTTDYKKQYGKTYEEAIMELIKDIEL